MPTVNGVLSSAIAQAKGLQLKANSFYRAVKGHEARVRMQDQYNRLVKGAQNSRHSIC